MIPQIGKYQDLVKEAAKRVRSGRQPDFTAYDNAYREGRYEAAVYLIQDIIAEHPKSAAARYKAGLALSRDGQLARSDAELRLAQELSPREYGSQVRRARKVVADKQAKAAAALESRLASAGYKRPVVPNVLAVRAMISELSHLPVQSAEVRLRIAELAYDIEDYRTALSNLESQPLGALTHQELLHLARSRSETGRRDVQDILGAVNKILKAKGKPRWQAHQLLQASGDPMRALEQYRTERSLSASREASDWEGAYSLALAAGQRRRAVGYAALAATMGPTKRRLLRLALAAEQEEMYDVALEAASAASAMSGDEQNEALLRTSVITLREAEDPQEAAAVAYPFWRDADTLGDLAKRLGLDVSTDDAQRDDEPGSEAPGLETPVSEVEASSAANRPLEQSLTVAAEYARLEGSTLAAALSDPEQHAAVAREIATAARRRLYASAEHDPRRYIDLSAALAFAGDYELAVEYLSASERVPGAYKYDAGALSEAQTKAARYIDHRTHLPVYEDVFVWESHFGNKVDCNPYAMYKEVRRRPEFADATHVWVVNDPEAIPSDVMDDPNVVLTRRESHGYWLALATAKHLANNATFPPGFVRRDGQNYVNTWHGTPLKKIGRDSLDTPLDHGNTLRNFLHATTLAVPNDFTARVMTENQGLRELDAPNVAVVGSARVDLLLENVAESRGIRSRAGIPDDGQPVVLYAPTWRGQMGAQAFDVQRLKTDLARLQEISGVHLVFRGHPLSREMLAGALGDINVPPDSISTYELMAIADTLITDYSSLAIDYLALRRPTVFYVYDYEQYERERGMYLSPDQLPGFVASTISDVVEYVERFRDGDRARALESESLDAVADFIRYEDGHAAARTVDLLLNPGPKVGEGRSRPTILIHHAFTSAAASRALIAELAAADLDALDVTLVFDGKVAQQNPEITNSLLELDRRIRVHPRKGGVRLAVEDYWADRLFFRDPKIPFAERVSPYTHVLRDEAFRLWANRQFDVSVCVGQTSPLWLGLMSMSGAAKTSVYVADAPVSALPGTARDFVAGFDYVADSLAEALAKGRD